MPGRAHAALAGAEEAPLSPDAQFRAAHQARMDRTAAEQSRANADPRGEADNAARAENGSAQQKTPPAKPLGSAQKSTPPPAAASGAAALTAQGPATVLGQLPPPFLQAQSALPPGYESLDAISAHGGALDPAAAGLVKPKVSAAQSPRAFVAEIARIIGRRGAAGARQFDIRLDPPELGRIDVKLKFSADGKMRAHLVFDRQDALDMVQRDAKTLERVLQQDGFSLDGDALEFSTRGFDGFASPEKGSDREDGREARDGRNGDDPDLAETAPRHIVDLRYGVDIRI